MKKKLLFTNLIFMLKSNSLTTYIVFYEIIRI